MNVTFPPLIEAIKYLQLLALQINAEKFFFGIRKNLVEFDEVLEVCFYYNVISQVTLQHDNAIS